MSDLFDMVQLIEEPPTVDLEVWQDEAPIPKRLQAQLFGQDRAEVPGWSRSVAKVAAGLAALLESVGDAERAELAEVEEEAYRAARRRKLARVVLDAEHVHE